MRLWRGWWWHLLIVPACIGYQVIVHTALVDTYAESIRLALACIPLALLAYWVVRYAHHKGRWALVLLGIAIALYLVEKKGDRALPAANALTHSFLNLFMLWLFGRTLLRGREPLVTGFARRFHGTIQPYIDGVVMVSKSEATGRNARPVANVATKTITDFTALRRELKVPEPV